MLSIIIPTYNRRLPLQRCLETVVAAYYSGLEVIVIDDHSEDETTGYLRELSQQHAFIKVLCNPVNMGVNYSRNRGIEQATNPYILFLDSDDQLTDGALVAVRATITQYPFTTHFLFVVSDRSGEFQNMKSEARVTYEDWISRKVSGDFTHVVRTDIMERHLFFEEFRTFEHLNWLRVKKLTSPQLMIPVIVANRERNRGDSLAGSMTLKSVEAMQTKFRSQIVFYSLYYNDLKKYFPVSLSRHLLITILLGAACNKKKDCRSLMRYARQLPIKLAANILLLLPASLLQYGILKYSAYRNR